MSFVIGEAELESSQTGYALEVSFVDVTFQSGSPIDVPHQVKYGPASTSPNNILNIDASGTVTILKSGPLLFKSRIRAGRSGAAGYSRLMFWVEISSNNGVTWSILGNSVDLQLDNSSESDVFFDFSALYLTQGLKLRTLFARSSTGSDYGDLMASAPSAALATYGVPISPSAQISVYRDIGYNYT